jgi:hypothetical protein
VRVKPQISQMTEEAKLKLAEILLCSGFKLGLHQSE